MPAQNIYDDPDFLRGYVTLDRQIHGLDGAAEWPAFQALHRLWFLLVRATRRATHSRDDLPLDEHEDRKHDG